MLSQVAIILLICRTALSQSSLCAVVPNGSYIRSSMSCNSYNRCVNGQPIHGECPKGLAFNPSNQMCDYNIEVDCRLCSPFGIQNIPDPDNCNIYYRCVNGIRTTMVCPSGLLFDRRFGDCNIAQMVDCGTKNLICAPFSTLGTITIGNPRDCSSYYYCLNGHAFEALCPTDLFYNPYTALCERRGTTNFCQGAGPLITTPLPEITTREYLSTQGPTTTTPRIIYFTTTRTTTDAPTSKPTETTSTSTTTTTTTTTTSTTTSPPVPTTTTTTAAPVLSCETGRTGYYPYPPPDSCTRYYYCFYESMRYTYECPEGQFFTPGARECSDAVPPGCEHLVS